MSPGACKLTSITEISELRQLRDLYLRDWPTNCVGYYALDNFIRWLELAPELENLHFFTLDGDWRSEGLVLIVDRYQLFVNALNGASNELLSKAISQLDWSTGLKVSSFLERHRWAVLKVVQEHQLVIEYDSLTLLYYMPREEAINLEVSCPEGYYLRPLRPEVDAEEIDALWPNRHQGSLFLMKRLIAWNANMGVYTTATNELVAWCLRLQGGFLGALQVKDSHKRLGLGYLVTLATSKRIAEMGHDVMACVGHDNQPSRGMFDKCGFKVIDSCYWLRTLPTKEQFSWPDGQ